MSRKNKNSKTNNLKIASIFCISVAIFVAISVIFKLAIVVKNSGFDGKHDFNVQFYQDKNIAVVSFSPISSSIYTLNIEDTKTNPFSIERMFEVPLDGVVKIKTNEKLEEGLDSLFKSALLGHADTKLTAIDPAAEIIPTKNNWGKFFR